MESIPGFQKALADGSLQELRAFPKADLHRHSILGTGLRNIEKWAGISLPKPPARMESLDEMRTYLHDILYPHILNRDGFEFTAESAIDDAVHDGVAILEMSLDVRFIEMYADGLRGFLDFVGRLVARSPGRIQFRPEIGISKDRDPRTQIPPASECIGSGLFRSIDIYGNELAQPPEAYSGLYSEAGKRGLKLKAHVGEFASAAHVLRTAQVLHLDEVQHGISAATSRETMQFLRTHGIRLNVCPSSNVALSRVARISAHPIRRLVDDGVRVSINSDDPTIFGRSVSEEYLALYAAAVLSAAELDGIREDSLRS